MELNREQIVKFEEITAEDIISGSESLTDLIQEAYKAALHEQIRANSIMISKRLAKVKRFGFNFGCAWSEMPPLICGLEAYITDELPDEFAFGLVEAPITQRELLIKETSKRVREEIVRKMQERLKALLKTDYINGSREQALFSIDQIAKELLEGET